MSIDREINARVEAYRNNPQALQAKYARNKQLVDLLALQSLKSDLDKKRSQMELALNTNPATIKQQREREVFGRTAEDVAQQLGGLLQTAKNQQIAQRRPAPQGLGALMPQQGQRPQQPQTRMMQAGGIVGFQTGELVEAPTSLEDLPDKGVNQGQLRDVARAQIKQLLEGGVSPEVIKQEVPPQYVGLVDEVVQKSRATAPAGPMEEVVVTGQREQAQPVQKVDKPSSKEAEPVSPGAQIDVTNYSLLRGPTKSRSGKEDDPSMLSKVMKGLGAIGEGFAERTGESIEEASDIRKRMREALTPESVLEAQRTGEYKYNIPDQAQPPQDKAEGIATIAESIIPTADNALVLRSQQNVPAGTSVVPSGGGTAPAKPQGFDLETALEKVAPVEYTPVDRTGTDAVGIERLKRFGMDPDSLKSPEDVGKEAYDTAYKQLGIEAKDAERRKGLEALAALDAAQTDPDRLRRDRLIRFLTAGAGRGNTALAAAGAASANLGMEQRRNIRARQIERNNMVKEIQNANTTLIQSAQARGDTATTRQANIVNNAMQALAQYDEAELAARRTDATNKMSASIANYERKMSEIELLAEQAQNRIQARIDRGEALRDVQNDARDDLEALEEQFSTLQAEAIRGDAGVMRIDKEIDQELKRSSPDQDRLKALRERRVVEIERVRQEFIIAHPNLYDRRQSLVNTINQLGSQIQSTLGVGSGVSAQQVDDAVQRQLQKGTPSYLQPYNP